MSPLPLFYASIAVLNRETDRARRVIDGARSVAFARGAHLIPAVADEFATAGRELPIVFVESDGAPSPVFVVGLETGTNVFVTDAGRWDARYVPAYLRRYPFILVEVAGTEGIVCIDGGYLEVPEQADDGGEALFAADGANTPYFDATIAFLNEYAEAARRTQRFVALLRDRKLFKDIVVETVRPDGQAAALHTYRIVDEAKLNQLSPKAFAALREAGALPLIYAHLFSLAALADVGDKARGPIAPPA